MMKAWIISNPWDDEGRQALTFADTRNEAKSHAGWFDIECDWIDLRAIRAKTFDNMENLSEKELMRMQWHEDWWFEYGNDRLPHFDEEGVTEQTFDDWWSRTYGNEGSGDE